MGDVAEKLHYFVRLMHPLRRRRNAGHCFVIPYFTYPFPLKALLGNFTHFGSRLFWVNYASMPGILVPSKPGVKSPTLDFYPFPLKAAVK